MKVFFPLVLLTIMLSVTAQQPKPIPGQYLVFLKETAATPVKAQEKKNANRMQKLALNKAARDKAFEKVRQVQNRKKIANSKVLTVFTDVAAGFVAKLTEAEKRELEIDPDVAEVLQDHEIEIGPVSIDPDPSDISFSNGEASHAETLNGGPSSYEMITNGSSKSPAQYTGCNITTAGNFAEGSRKSTYIWILDTGIDTDHPDLNVVTQYAKSCIFLHPSFEDDHGHGTHCAGIAAARNNSYGVVGVSAGAKVVPVKVLNSNGKGAWSTLISGLDHVAKYDIPGDVVSMSIGGYGYSNCENTNTKMRDAIRALGNSGTYVVMAAGNDAGDAKLNLPGCINGTRVYTVGSITCNNVCSSFSNLNTSSSVPVDWVAVGSSVYSTYINGSYKTMSGTSMATPAVAGIVHSRGAAPASGGTVSCKNKTYKIAKR